jgi:hypothetical protein
VLQAFSLAVTAACACGIGPAASRTHIRLNAYVSGSGQVYQGGRDQHITER